jgi:oxygen-independent coproporphyrinogen-3 oxidase
VRYSITLPAFSKLETKNKAGVYLHIPFCRSRCSYCDFATDVFRNAETVDRYVSSLVTEIEGSSAAGVPVDTIYFGGGTPSLLSPEQIDNVLDAVRSKFSVDSDAEVTMEMNPATVTPRTLERYKQSGVNRASFGVQTFDDVELKRLARGHTAQDARDTFELLRRAGFENISFDLIGGLPEQTLTDWERNLDEAVMLGPEHVSLYLLEVHEGTPLAEQIRSERRPMPDEEAAAEMYELMLTKLSGAGYVQYEISNFAKPGFESRHNTKYWTLDPVYGFGVSAHSFDGRQRYSNQRDTLMYVRSIENGDPVEVHRETINAESEFAFLGLRLNRGIDLNDFRDRFGKDLMERHAEELEALFAAGLIARFDNFLSLTPRGRLYSNEVFRIFV